ncbi:hypothetical protein [Vibrio phage vB_VibM_10AMN]|uniref:Uncharacterized protein n=1 Tax=Staphylococcus phage vB_VibM_10AMN12 TaxID=3076785 RepID=A0AA96KTN5_9CAUD|nr:hypothetical protein [Vibrio phage vB_VibM_10AMN]WNO47519.1 hypothetical protein [Staphylococcus phage vB_VibM_10AMN12]
MSKDCITVNLSYDKEDLIDEETLIEDYNGDIVEYLKSLLKDGGKHEFIDWFEIENIEEEK